MSRIAGRGFIVGLGSNVASERNVAAVLNALLLHFAQVLLSRVVYTAPEGVASTQWFVNAALFIPCDLGADALKQICNRIEIELGRDRTHPQRKWRDRPADLDILHHCDDVSACEGWQVKERYLAPLVDELLAYIQNRTPPINPATTVHLYLNDAALSPSLGQTPTTIYRDHTAGLIRII